MILGTTLRQGRRLVAKRPSALIGGGTSTPARSFAALLSEPRARPTATATPRLAGASSNAAPWRRSTCRPPLQALGQSYHTSLPSLQTNDALGQYQSYHTSIPILQTNDKAAESTTADADSQLPRALTPRLRAAIASDLRSVDFDGNGRIDADELRSLLRKHGESFTEAEAIELSELYYSSTGAGAVDIDRFLEALDAAAAGEKGEGKLLAGKGAFKTHPLGIGTCASEYMYSKTHGKYSEEDLDIKLTHVEPVTFSDKSALFAVKCVRLVFDTATLWNIGSVTKAKILHRAIFLETIAAIPGMVAAIIRHFRSLRNMARDGGMLNMFLEEANNERMHLLTFIRMKEPGYLFRTAVIGAQFGFGSFFLTAYMVNPDWCHRFIGYIEEEACHTYTKILDEMDKAPEGSELAVWRDEGAPKIAKGYWHLGEEGTVYDVMKAVRADEAEHRDVNHAVSGVPENTVNPLYDPRDKLDSMMKRYVQDIMQKEAGKQTRVA